VLTMEDWASVRHLHSQGLSCRAIARRLALSRNTVQKYLADPRQPHYTPRPGDPELLGPYKDHLRARLTEFPELSSTRLLGEIREQGFRGSYSTVLRFIRPLRREKEVLAVYRFETAPGLQAQVDWAYFGTVEEDGRRKKLYAFLMTLGYSRAKYVEFTTDLSTPTFIACHLRAFEYFGGHPKEILYDNTKNVILWRAVGVDRNQFNPLFLDFVAYYGITPRLCAVYRAQTKGKVENSVKFVRGNFFVGTYFSSRDDLNRRVILWCNDVNQRIHGTTHVAPIDRLEEEQLTKVDGRAPYPIVQTFYRQIQRDAMVRFLGNQYSVPWRFAGKSATLRLGGEGFVVEVNGQEVCRHPLVPGTGHVVQVEGHRAGLLAAIRRQNQVRQALLESFPSLPEAPDVQRRELSAYDRVLEEGT